MSSILSNMQNWLEIICNVEELMSITLKGKMTAQKWTNIGKNVENPQLVQ